MRQPACRRRTRANVESITSGLPTAGAQSRPVSVDHYENFPVASWLCPPALRPAVRAIYWYARTADDLADEGDATPDERRRDLAAYREDFLAAIAGGTPSGRWQ